MESGRIWTSRFRNAELNKGIYTVVGIVRYMPRFKTKYPISGNIIQIAPTKELFNENNRERFTEPYIKHLDEVGFPLIGALIREYRSMGKDLVLCCYEDVRDGRDWCHRLVFAEWWEKQTGEKILELPEAREMKDFLKREQQKRQDAEFTQMSLDLK